MIAAFNHDCWRQNNRYIAQVRPSFFRLEDRRTAINHQGLHQFVSTHNHDRGRARLKQTVPFGAGLQNAVVAEGFDRLRQRASHTPRCASFDLTIAFNKKRSLRGACELIVVPIDSPQRQRHIPLTPPIVSIFARRYDDHLFGVAYEHRAGMLSLA